jgi:hypothetical protein
MIRLRRAVRLLPLIPLFLLCASCSDFWVSNSSTASVTLGPGVILKAAVGTTPGDTNQFHLYANTVGGTTTDITSSATWTSSNSAVATVGTSGTTPATTPGLVTVVGTSGNITVVITATYGGQTATANVLTYTGAPPTSLTLAGSGGAAIPASVTPGQVFQLAAGATPSLNGTANFNVSSYVTWTSSNTSVATVDVNGNVSVLSTAPTTGTVTFTITAATTISGTTVSSPGVQFTVL